MKTYLIREIPDDLMKLCSSKLKLKGISMREFFIKCMEAYIENYNPNQKEI